MCRRKLRQSVAEVFRMVDEDGSGKLGRAEVALLAAKVTKKFAGVEFDPPFELESDFAAMAKGKDEVTCARTPPLPPPPSRFVMLLLINQGSVAKPQPFVASERIIRIAQMRRCKLVCSQSCMVFRILTEDLSSKPVRVPLWFGWHRR